VVGGGTAGPRSRRGLVEGGREVLVLEAGPDPGPARLARLARRPGRCDHRALGTSLAKGSTPPRPTRTRW